MKNIILFFGILITSFANAQNVTIVNPWLKARILATNTTNDLRAKDLNGNWLKIDQNSDGEIQVSEALNVSYYFDADGIYISSYEGLNSFTNLESLLLSYNQTPVPLNLSGLANLKFLLCYMNSITALDITGCNSLEEINLDQNYLTTLDVSGINTLKYLRCQNNDITSINLTSTPALIELLCFSNNLTSLNVNNNPNLEVLNCTNNSLTSLNLNNCPSLNLLRCDTNNLQVLDVANAVSLLEIYCGYNDLETLDVSNCSLLTYLDCTNNNIINLNINNGYNWVASYDYLGSFRGYNNNFISEVCTSLASVPSLSSYYMPYTSNVTDCSVLNVDQNEASKIAFYPNPAKDKIYFSDKIDSIAVYDVKGAQLKNFILNNSEMDVSRLSSGLYILEIHSENKTTYNKLIIQ